jgi:hypothetical protein
MKIREFFSVVPAFLASAALLAGCSTSHVATASGPGSLVTNAEAMSKTPSKTSKGAGMMGGMRVGRIDPTDPKVQIVRCRLNRLTDLVFLGKIEEVVMSDPSDFKLATIRHKSRTHLVLKPLKESRSDLFVFGVNYVRYLRLKAVSKEQDYQVRIYARGEKRAPYP